jgi:hypothetical protein
MNGANMKIRKVVIAKFEVSTMLFYFFFRWLARLGRLKTFTISNQRNIPEDHCSESRRYFWGTAVAQWLRCRATNRKVAYSIPDGVIGIFH